MTTTVIQDSPDDRMTIEVDDRHVMITREFMCKLRGQAGEDWRTDPEAGLCFEVKHLPQFLAALASHSPSVGEVPCSGFMGQDFRCEKGTRGCDAHPRQRTSDALPELPSFGACPEEEDAQRTNEAQPEPLVGAVALDYHLARRMVGADPKESLAEALKRRSDNPLRTPFDAGWRIEKASCRCNREDDGHGWAVLWQDRMVRCLGCLRDACSETASYEAVAVHFETEAGRHPEGSSEREIFKSMAWRTRKLSTRTGGETKP